MAGDESGPKGPDVDSIEAAELLGADKGLP